VLIVEDDSATGLIVLQLLLDEGYAASLLSIASSDTFRAAVGRLEPDCILLDSGAGSEYGAAWLEAVWSYTRRPPVPVVMFTAQHSAAEEVAAQPTERSAAIFAVVAKPFDIDELLETVASTVGAVARFDRSEVADLEPTETLVQRLQEMGARDVRSSSRREWVSFYAADALTILFWSQRDGVYHVLRQPVEAGFLRPIGSFFDVPPTTSRRRWAGGTG